MIEIDSVQAGHWFKYLKERNTNFCLQGTAPTYSIPTFILIYFNEKLKIEILDTSDILGISFLIASSNYYLKKCAFSN